MAETNFKIFAEGATTIQTDAEYISDTQRQSGVVPGLAKPALHNKLYKQATIMAAALAQVMVEQGNNALDSDYSGLVQSIRNTFLLTLNGEKPTNGNLKKNFVFSVNDNLPDAKGNVTLDIAVLDKIYQIGDIKVTVNNTNPGTVIGGTWELLEAGDYIRTAGTIGDKTYVPATRGGTLSYTLSVENMPPHNHSANIYGAGAHSHHYAIKGDPNTDGNQNFNIPGYGSQLGTSGTGTTSTDGIHTHSISIYNTGGGKAFTIEPTFKSLYFWVRTA